jgi:hypothetical protein
MDGSREQKEMTAGLDIGDRYSYLCLIDQESGEAIEEGRLRTSPETFRRRFGSERPMRIAIEAGTHSPWASRVLEDCGHEVLVANARKLRLIYANKRKTDEVDAENLARLSSKEVAGCATGSARPCRHPSEGAGFSPSSTRFCVALVLCTRAGTKIISHIPLCARFHGEPYRHRLESRANFRECLFHALG